MRSTVVLLFLLAVTSLECSGFEFTAERVVFVTTIGTKKGKLGDLEVRSSSSPSVVYSRVGTSTLVNVNRNTGSLTLLKDLDEAVAAQSNNAEITFKATSNGQTAQTKVVIVIVPLHYGDQFAQPIIEEVKAIVKSNTISFQHIVASDLLRFFRRIDAGDPAEQNSVAEIRIEKVVEKTKNKILAIYKKKYGDKAIVHGLLHVKELFSEKIIKLIEREATCHETIGVSPQLCLTNSPFRTFDGTCNNLQRPHIGAADTTFLRLQPAKYFDVDGINDPIGYPQQPNAPDVPSPFKISNDFIIDKVATSSEDLTHSVMQIGQFLDHDIDLTADSEGSDECFKSSCDDPPPPFEAPCYPILPLSNGKPTCIAFIRAAAACQADGYPKARQQINLISSFVDASQIYGPNKKVADSLRQLQNEKGLLRVSTGKLLPLDTSATANQLCTDLGVCYLAGDVRSNEQPSLNSFHTLFVREHNRMAKKLKAINTHWDGERTYQETRKIMGAVFQKIIYSDYLPLIVGTGTIPEYAGYDENVNPGIANAFATGAYRFGHSTIRPEFDLLNENFEPVASPLDLRFMFFNNTVIKNKGIEPVLLGLVGNKSGTVDRHLPPGVIKHLFERAEMPGLNLAALNIQRSRDHGLPGYNTYRKFCGLSDAQTIEDTKNEIKDPENREILKRLYNDDPNLVELWIAGLAEAPAPGGTVGPIFRCVIADQFRRTRDGDRFFYQKDGIFQKNQLKEIEKTSLSRIYCDNVKGIVSIQKNAFKVPTILDPRISCQRIPGINFCVFKECLTGVPKFDETTGTCSCVCEPPPNVPRCQTSWFSEPKFTPPFHIAADGHGDLGARFVDLNADGRMDQVYHRWINSKNIQKGAYLNVPNFGFKFAPQYTPPFHIAADGYADLGARFVDLNGDNKIDMVYHRWLNSNYQQKGAYLNTGNGWKWAPQFTPPFHIAADGYGDLGARFIELNGDGKIDFVYHRWINSGHQQKGAYLNTGNGWKWAPEFTPPFHIAADNHGDLGARFVDLNADGRMDMVYHRWLSSSNQQKNAWLNDGKKWVEASQFTPPFHIAANGYHDLGARFVDVNGDGKIDMVYHRWINGQNQQKGAYINTGTAWEFTPAYTPPFHISADGHGDLGARFADVNGDGLVDFVYHRWLSSSNQQKGAYINTRCGWKNTPEYTPPFHIAANGYADLGARFVELNGDGAVDMAYHRWLNSNYQQKGAYLACGKSPVSSCVTNNLSASCSSCCQKPRL